MFAMTCGAVIVMRESGIEAYDPGYRSPWYPWLHLFGIGTAIGFIGEMGWSTIAFSLLLLLSGGWWYQRYAPGDHELERLEKSARENKRGLWADPDPIPPWEFRRKRRRR